MNAFSRRNLQGKKVLLLFLLTNFVYAFMLVVTIPQLLIYSNGILIMDMMPTGYDLAHVTALLGKMGQEGRSFYLFRQIPTDMIYPGLFAISYSLLLGYFLKKVGKLESKLIYLCWLPILAGVSDYLENFGIINLLINFPDISSAVVALTNVFTILKSGFSTLYFVVLIVVFIVFVVKVIGGNLSKK
ncbi:hypothetical protein R9C00_02735 [Flammeovirgaceae bacterium SG7u.111]|nr:hypothetical protein [Flammeovirgaceae bacterium SG7u.132]WPO36356.1 hypothetical protein R9C00_02735 [Flammeovirgaceae bacterium SG7u.111]